jgi:hypothetical protein
VYQRWVLDIVDWGELPTVLRAFFYSADQIEPAYVRVEREEAKAKCRLETRRGFDRAEIYPDRKTGCGKRYVLVEVMA